MEPTDDEVDEDGGWFFEVTSPSAEANGFGYWVWRDLRDIFDAEDFDQLEEKQEVVIRRKWYTLDEIRRVGEEE